MDPLHHIDSEVKGDHLSWSAVAQRITIGVAGAAVFGVGSLFANMNTKVTQHETRLSILEQRLEKVPDIDRNVIALSGKVDVLNQKLDDARDTLKERADGRVR